MAALPADATRQPRAYWPLRYTALATDQNYRLTQYESGDVGCAANSAKRNLAGSATDMTALVVGGGGVVWFSTFEPLVLRSYPLYKIHPTLSPHIIFFHTKNLKNSLFLSVLTPSDLSLPPLAR